MPLVISTLHSKGGVGKSTIALFLARAMQQEGNEILVLDTDPQGTASSWAHSQEDDSDQPLVLHTPSIQQLERELKRLGQAYDAVIIDGSAKLEGSTGALIRLSDAVLIPIQPSPADIWASSDIVELIVARQEATGGEPAAAFVINRAITGTNLADDVGAIVENMGIPVLPARLSQRVAFAESLIAGETPLEYNRSGKAAQEIVDLRDSVYELLSRKYTNHG